MATLIHERVERPSGSNTELVAGALAVLLVPAVAVKFLFAGTRVSLTAINFIQLALAAGLLNLAVHVVAKVVRWARASNRDGVRARRPRSRASRISGPDVAMPESKPPEPRAQLR
ncbi:MAG: hypothetical protein JWM82_965 [Myxococcales bacterium]|nr:hypothetical protein [Myxococcales bacterium]